MAQIQTYSAITKAALATDDQLIVLDKSGPNTVKNMTVAEANKQWTTVETFAAATVGAFDFVQSATPSATASGETWLDTDDGKVYKSSGTGTGNWGTAIYELMLYGNLTKAVGNINSPIVDLDLQNSLNLVRGAGSVTFTRTTAKKYTNRDGTVAEAAINTGAFEKDGLRHDPGTTELFLQTEDFNTTWVKNDCTVSTNVATAPDGNVTADKFIPDNLSTNAYIYQTMSFTDGLNYTISCFVEQNGSLDEIRASFPSSAFTSVVYVSFNLSTKTITEVPGSGTIVDSGYDEIQPGIFRFFCTATATATTSGATAIRCAQTGDGTSGFNLWGANLTQTNGLFPYIPATTVPVVTGADNLSIQYDGNIPSKTGNMSIVIDFMLASIESNDYLIVATGETSRMMVVNKSTRRVNIYHGTTASTSVLQTDRRTQYRFAYVADGTNLKGYFDGILDKTISQETPTGTGSVIRIGSAVTNGVNGWIKRVRIYDFDLTASEIRIA